MMVDNLCKVYTGLSPFQVMREPFGEVIDLYADFIRINQKQEESKNKKYASDDAGWW